MAPRVRTTSRLLEIVEAAIRVFGRKGYALTQMDDIAEAANVSKGTLYNYFNSKAHLFAYVLENGMPDEDAPMSLPEMSVIKSDKELLKQLRDKLKKESRLGNVNRFLKRKPDEIDLENELYEILSEWWDLLERNRVQIIVLKRSATEFP
ncbi:TetR/AcrR family transcriptional regulator [Candidatus Poribacteria bacterium]|nr:TetR/AcrR family transcriptional regulator [Candidatus Poribacteria bacterium]